MKAKDLTKDELIKENRRLFRILRQRERRIQKEGIELSSPLYAHSKLQEIRANTPKDLTSLDEPELRELYRDLTYIKDLKSSTLKGARRAAEKFEPIRPIIESLSKETRDKYWDVYKHLYEETALIEKFKYDVFNEVFNEASRYGTDTVNLEKAISALHDKVYRKQQKDKLTDNEAQKLFEKVIISEDFSLMINDVGSEEFEKMLNKYIK